ncbi:hypothetical protein SCLARK_001619 [Spiroplasma clarkii]|nr:hypothetical protein SCLARK_001619 [Spiroplasma clarkii]
MQKYEKFPEVFSIYKQVIRDKQRLKEMKKICMNTNGWLERKKMSFLKLNLKWKSY